MNSPATKETAALNAVEIAEEEVPAGERNAPRRRAHIGALAYYAATELANLVVAYNARRLVR